MAELDWELVTAVYSDDIIGEKSRQIFEEVVTDYHICIHQSLSVNEIQQVTAADWPKGTVFIGTPGKGSSTCLLYFLQKRGTHSLFLSL